MYNYSRIINLISDARFVCNSVQRSDVQDINESINNEQSIMDSNRNEYMWNLYSHNGQNTYSINNNNNIISNRTTSDAETQRTNEHNIMKY